MLQDTLDRHISHYECRLYLFLPPYRIKASHGITQRVLVNSYFCLLLGFVYSCIINKILYAESEKFYNLQFAIYEIYLFISPGMLVFKMGIALVAEHVLHVVGAL